MLCTVCNTLGRSKCRARFVVCVCVFCQGGGGGCAYSYSCVKFVLFFLCALALSEDEVNDTWNSHIGVNLGCSTYSSAAGAVPQFPRVLYVAEVRNVYNKYLVAVHWGKGRQQILLALHYSSVCKQLIYSVFSATHCTCMIHII